jgi:dTDP-4-amino-4,6-dideoxy-D-galactose acyltransferase
MSPEDLAQAAPAEFSPLAGFTDDEKLLCRSALANLRTIVSERQTEVVCIEGGLAAERVSDWDSRLLGRRSSVVRVFAATGPAPAAALARGVIDRLVTDGVRYAVARLASHRVAEMQALESVGFRFVDGLLTFQAATEEVLSRSRWEAGARPGRPDDASVLGAIAESAFTFDRFHNDPVVPRSVADELHAEWIRGSLNGANDETVITVDGDQGPCGFVTFKVEESEGVRFGTIALVAVAASHRGRGLARQLTLEAVRRLSENGITQCRVGTQLANMPASRLYLALGFRLSRTSVSLRWAAPA